MRMFLSIMSIIIATVVLFFVALGGGIWIGFATHSFLWGFLASIAALAATFKINLVLYRALHKMGRKSTKPWLDSVSRLPFKMAWDGTGIAVDPEKEEIHLLGDFSGRSASKVFSFNDVREWGAVARSECNTVIELKQEHHGA